ncbi:hypothetical protein DSM03_102544 [Leeuwenhoekiella aestuarii]|uniref:DUF6268 domain-containing protein n=1 Tax=Leeuwenhoekiella aestuarii TaxID=2249426 RepID=A0A4Q0NV06_9FLAO|nr:DUF6268 family outer membrane beta-barrel protein [Leeuwenhoekiella aestuarii]RXG15222.1 hypothetical protein DSM04_103110 [Leeuwenhoekiella aestuarii]RXG17667.1 hypothetical protein DSM03_102544 [Leeuwenhoekiella aestuarii]
MRIVYQIVFAVLSGSLLHAQNYIDLANLSYSITPQNQFEDYEAQTQVEEVEFQFTFPKVLDDKNTFIATVMLESNALRLDPTITQRTTLASLGLALGFNHKYSDQLAITYLVIPKIASDLSFISSEGLQLGGLALATLKKNENFNYKIGLYANTEAFGLFLVPYVGFYYLSPSKRFEAYITTINGDINYMLTDKLNIGGDVNGLTSSYALSEPYFGTSPEYFAKNTTEFFAYLRYPISKGLYLKAKAGYSITRTYKVFEQDDKVALGLSLFYLGDDRNQLNTPLQKGALFKLELLYRFQL